MLDRTDQILQCVFNLHAFSIPAASLSMFQWRMHYFWTVVSEVGISAILMCREFKLGTLNSCPITIIFSPKYIQGNSLFFMLLGWKNNVSVLLFLSFSGLWVRCFKMETCDIYKRILGNFSTKKIKQRNPQTKQKFIPLSPSMTKLFLDLKLQGMQQLLFPKFQDKILMMANDDLTTKRGR